MGLCIFTLFSLLTITSAQTLPTRVNQTELQTAMAEMRASSYYGFVILLDMLNETIRTATFNREITFLMPGDLELSQSPISQGSLRGFLLTHSIPEPLPFNEITHIPNGALIPSGITNRMIRVTTHGRQHIFLNNAQIISPNICSGPIIKCHGISAVLDNRRHPAIGSVATAPLPENSGEFGGQDSAVASSSALSPGV
ncbi:hypothetical protein GIB67_013404 [Kingdonia uniflora]|uniref:FAS1 domain-containing protein n=1 Tax=Kingdonia uniflora TaxID=39325 RepID=A0A7J7LQX5_9MAGN|nr:hypothetical protein GIB67_013404 [Kingdonia uniflora]